MVSHLQNNIGNDWATQLHHSTTFGMFPTEHSSILEPEALLQLFVNEWVDLTIVFFFTSYFYEASSEKPNIRAFLNTNTIACDWLKSHHAKAEEHISSLYSYHSDKEYFFAPYLAKTTWGKDQTCYLLSQVIESPFSEVNFTWTMIPCKQQASDLECGYMRCYRSIH
ncbi:hypothetical protein R6Q57_009888 [Mikania cordata]